MLLRRWPINKCADIARKMISPQPHIGSYYAASANEIPDYSPLRGAQSSDVCVIGAGFTGLSAALHLAERGFKVHVLEANKVAWGASGRNGGQMIGGISGENRISKSLGPVSYTHLTLPTKA